MERFQNMKRKELNALASEHKIRNYSRMRIDDLRIAIKEAVDSQNNLEDFSNAPSSYQEEPFLDSTLETQTYNAAYEQAIAGAPGIDDFTIPDYYDQDMLFLLPVHSAKQFINWEISKHTSQSIKREHNIQRVNYSVRMQQEDGHILANADVPRIGTWYFNVEAPLKRVWAEIGFKDNHGNYKTILKSSTVMLPSGLVSKNYDLNWLLVSNDWDEIFKYCGASDETIFQGASGVKHIKRIKQYLMSSKTGEKK